MVMVIFITSGFLLLWVARILSHAPGPRRVSGRPLTLWRLRAELVADHRDHLLLEAHAVPDGHHLDLPAGAPGEIKRNGSQLGCGGTKGADLIGRHWCVPPQSHRPRPSRPAATIQFPTSALAIARAITATPIQKMTEGLVRKVQILGIGVLPVFIALGDGEIYIRERIVCQ